MKFPSIKNLAVSAANTVKRFPYEIIFVLAGTVAATVNIEWDKISPADQNWCCRIMMMANLGLLLNLAATLFTESKSFNTKKALLIRTVVALAALSLLFVLNPAEDAYDYVRFFLFSLGFHLLVSFAGFTGKANVDGFWQFNKVLFLRFLTCLLYSGVLYLGLLAAINASNFLFNLHFTYKINEVLFVWIAGIFNTVFFLAAVPYPTPALNHDQPYPKGLKIFTQYVLIPLATVYVVILLAYEVKISLLWSLPKGLVSSLVLGYAVFGILSILLVYPIRGHAENKWIKTYARSFYFLLIPLIVLLFLAVFARILPYGITEQRYFLLVLALWLAFITGYFLLFSKQNIKIIPVSLCIVTLLSIYGPQSAFSISRYSQRAKLVKLFEKYNSYKNGKLIPLGKTKMTEADGEEAIAKLHYLTDGKHMNYLQGYIGRDVYKVSDSLKKLNTHTGYGYNFSSNYDYALRDAQSEWLTTYLGLDKFASKSPWENIVYYNLDAEDKVMLDVSGFDYMIKMNEEFSGDDTTDIRKDGISVKMIADTTYNCKLYVNNEIALFDLKAITDSLVKKEGKIANGNKNYATLPANVLTVYRETPHYKVAFAITKLNSQYSKGKTKLVSEANGYYLVKKK